MAIYYPVFINLKDKPVLVVGGGAVAYRKVLGLIECGALVTVAAPALGDELQQVVREGNCQWLCKAYSPDDIRDAWMVFACTENEEVNSRVARDAEAGHCLVNVADDPDRCTFLVPSVLRRGDLSIAVSTSGSSPIAARRIRLDLEKLYGEEIAEYLNILRSWRPKVKSILPREKRPLFWQRVSDGQVEKLIKDGHVEQAKEVIAIVQSLLD
jgi:precorrin-2 dehydrogenase/sirohydrochlorin ferrochelatase